MELKADIGVEGELFQSIKRISTLQDVYEFFMAKAEAFGMPTLALYARYCYRFKEASQCTHLRERLVATLVFSLAVLLGLGTVFVYARCMFNKNSLLS